MMTVAVETRMAFSAHAVIRYQERAYAAGDVDRARAHLETLVPTARIVSLPPRGVDIVACRSDHGVLRVEAKGATSSKAGTVRYGQPFTRAQINTHVARAFYTAAAQLESTGFQKADLSAMAFPTTPDHRWFVDRIRGPISRLGIGIIWLLATPSG
jgi:hypothetical protein